MKVATSITYYVFMLWLVVFIWLGFNGTISFGNGIADFFILLAMGILGIGLRQGRRCKV